jgi:hypothetical protein
MSQFIKDLGLRLKSDRKTQVISGVVVLCLLWVMLGDNSPRRRGMRQQPQVDVGQNDPKERTEDLIQRFNGHLNQLTVQTNALREEVDANRKAMQDYEQTTAEIFKKIIERLAEVQNVSQPTPSDPSPAGGFMPPPISTDPVIDPVLEPINGEAPVADGPPDRPEKPRVAAIMPGDSVRVKLLAGVNAPTDGTPYPVVLKLVGDVIGPDGNSVPLGEARVIAAAQGSLTDSRVLFRLTRLSIRLPNGRRKEFGVDGWVVGEDGIRGMEGVLIDPIGKAIAGAGMAGGLAGLGQGLAAANTVNRFGVGNTPDTSFVKDGQMGEYAAGMALSSAAREWNSSIRERLAQLVPVVQVLSNREATAVFSQSLAIPDLLEQLDEEDSSVVYTSLD